MPKVSTISGLVPVTFCWDDVAMDISILPEKKNK